MRRSIYLWFCVLFFSNLMGTYRSVGEVPEDNRGSWNATPDPLKRHDPHSGTQLKQKLIREIHSDVKSFMREFPDIAHDINQTGRSVLEMKTFLWPLIDEIEAIQNDIATIKRYVQHLYKNLTTVGSDKLDRMTFDAIKNLTRLSNSSFSKLKNVYSGLRDNYNHMDENYKHVSDDISLIQQSLNFINMVWPTIESSVNKSLTKFDDLLMIQGEIKHELQMSKLEIHQELVRLEEKLEMALAGLHEDTKSISERIIAETMKMTAKITEIKDIIVYNCQLTPTNLGRNLKRTRFSITNILDYLPLIDRIAAIIHKFKELKPIVGIGGAVGAGQALGIPSELFGGLGAVMLFPNISLNTLWEIQSLLPMPAGTPPPTSPAPPSHPSWPFPFPEIPDIASLIPGFLPPEPSMAPPIAPGLPGRPAEVPGPPERPVGRPDISSEESLSDELPGVGDFEEPPLPPMPTPIPKPADPRDPILLKPIIPLNIDGLENHCACRCSCPCTCPKLPMTLSKTTPWWIHLPLFPDDSPECQCLCACPCPVENEEHSSPTITRRLGPWSNPTKPSKLPTLEEYPFLSNNPPFIPAVKYDIPHTEDCNQNIAILMKEIQFLRQDLQDLKMTVTNKLLNAKESIMGEMNFKFTEVTTALASIQRTNEFLHTDVKTATGSIQKLMEGEIVRTLYPKFGKITTALGDLKNDNRLLHDDVQLTAENLKAVIEHMYDPDIEMNREGSSKESLTRMSSLSNISVSEPPFSSSNIAPE